MAGIYVHIPFCEKKCAYCDFVSYSNRRDQVDGYLGLVEQEMAAAGELCKNEIFTSLFVGGGTPTYLDAAALSRLLAGIRRHFCLAENSEVTVEANPGTVDGRKLEALRKGGVNRLSFGVQSADDALLAAIGRIHTWQEFVESYGMAREAGFDNLSLDLMFGLPGQRVDGFLETLERAAGLRPEHISAYSLKVEEGTPLFDWVQRGRMQLPDEDEERAMYHKGTAFLKKMGYAQYELSNYARPGFVSRHNLIYWRREPYIGLGVAAHSFFGGARFANPSDFAGYERAVSSGSWAWLQGERVEGAEALFEAVMLGLRLNEGLDERAFEARYGTGFTIFKDAIEKGRKWELLRWEPPVLRLTARGRDLQNQALLPFLESLEEMDKKSLE